MGLVDKLAFQTTSNPDVAPEPFSRQSHRARWWILAVAVVLIALWRVGSFDKQLASAGLNAKPCVVTVMAGTLCGQEAKAWCRATDQLRALAPDQTDDAQRLCDDIRGL